MKWAAILGITFIVLLMVMYEWPKINQKQKREKAAFIVLTVIGWILSSMLVYFPHLPGPTQLVENIFKPLEKILEK